MDNVLQRDRRSRVKRLTIDVPGDVLTALKIHAARHETTIRELVTSLIERAIVKKGTHP
ncbi:hypothetical protein [Rhizobium leguminosarum]